MVIDAHVLPSSKQASKHTHICTMQSHQCGACLGLSQSLSQVHLKHLNLLKVLISKQMLTGPPLASRSILAAA